jgi:hypothetical protein
VPNAVLDAVEPAIYPVETPIHLLETEIDLLEAEIHLLETPIDAVRKIVEALVCPGRPLHESNATGFGIADMVACVTTLPLPSMGAGRPDTMGG